MERTSDFRKKTLSRYYKKGALYQLIMIHLKELLKKMKALILMEIKFLLKMRM